jgi:hypothetical protein
MRAGRTAAASPVNPGFRFVIQNCCGEVGWNIEGDTRLKGMIDDIDDPR